MMHLCRKLFSTILEQSGILPKLLIENFYPSKQLYDDLLKEDKIYDFEKYIYSLFSEKKELLKTDKNPFELMDEAGYILYECKSENEIQSNQETSNEMSGIKISAESISKFKNKK